jgi:hypothetical protein
MPESPRFGIALTLRSFFPNPAEIVLLRAIKRCWKILENGVESARCRGFHASVMKGSISQIIEIYTKITKV